MFDVTAVAPLITTTSNWNMPTLIFLAWQSFDRVRACGAARMD